MSVVQGGSGVHALCPSVYDYLRGVPVYDITVSVFEVPELAIREMLEKV